MYAVLYIDDDPDLLELGKIFLENTGDFAIDISTSARTSLGSMSGKSYDAIVSDYDMPVMDGIALLKAVRQQYGDIPFVLFTGRSREEVVIEAINNGVDFYIQKGGDPTVQFAELAHKVRQAILRKNAEHGLTESRTYLNQIFSSVKAGILVIDAETHRILDVNPAAAGLIQDTRENILGKECHRYICPAEKGNCPVTDCGYLVDNSERILITSDKRQIPIIKYVSPVMLSGKPALLETFIDNTERKKGEEKLSRAYEELRRDQEEIQAAYAELAANEQVLTNSYSVLAEHERQLAESERKYRDLFELNSALMLIMDPADGRIVDANPAACGYYGYTREEITGMDFSAISLSRSDFGEMYRSAENEKKIIDLRHRKRNGEIRNVKVFGAPIETGGRKLIYAIILDVTDNKKRLIAFGAVGAGVGVLFDVLLLVFGVYLLKGFIAFFACIIVLVVAMDRIDLQFSLFRR